ncbi:DNA/RNA nuclease SfsA [Hyphomicrobium sp.]|uniref:DNA/RNA nuclease SfsA n=1 Tax=Hyphomicrobium sp. TaxID=82 RepID=UPI0025C39174|nr:DNA/RNA nuclease SfsA [Hyphomicrobium sp.]MCC7253083.1 DNA/RNA nuclease SfsA [Hyphomicrobium sp.]
MKFPTPLVRGRLIKRYKRFLADVSLDTGELVTATCPNTGSMLGLAVPGAVVWLSVSASPTRKYPHTWELVEANLGRGPVLVGINTSHPNRLVSEAITAGLIPELSGYATLRREVKYGLSSRIDILLEDPQKGLAYVEVKNVHLSRQAGRAEFPDSVTARGVKHLVELSAMAAAGHRAVMLYLIQRDDAEHFALAGDIDPRYAEAFAAARDAGVEAIAYACRLTPQEIAIARAVPLEV